MVVQSLDELGDRSHGGRHGIAADPSTPGLSVGSAPVVGVERDGGEDPPALVDLGQREILELAATAGRSAGHQDTFQRYAVARGADEPTLLVAPGPGPPLSLGDPTVDVERDQHGSTPVLELRVATHKERKAAQSRASNAASTRSLAAVAAFGFASAASGSRGGARADARRSAPGPRRAGRGCRRPAAAGSRAHRTPSR